MKALVLSLFILSSPLSTLGQTLPLEKYVEAEISFCTTEIEAQKVVQAHKADGFGVAARMVQESQTCDTHYVGFKMKRIVSSLKVGVQTAYIVEIEVEMADDSWQPFYAMLITGGGGEEV